MPEGIDAVAAAVDFMEDHLHEPLTAAAVAAAVHYSPFHLHRLFTAALHLSVHDYLQRRRLTEAAEQLVFTRRPILDIALEAGFQSRQAFTDCFRALYKRPPGRFRQEGRCYPLLLPCALGREPVPLRPAACWQRRILPARAADLDDWMALTWASADGLPGLEETGHRARLRRAIAAGQALLLREGAEAAAGMVLEGGHIAFLAVRPQYRGRGLEAALVGRALEEAGTALTTTTFRAGDRSDTGWRALLTGLGFTGGALLTEFGYPTQRMVLRREDWR